MVTSPGCVMAVGSVSSGIPTQNCAMGQRHPSHSFPPMYRQEGQQESFTAVTDQCQNSSPWFEGLWPHPGLSLSIPRDPPRRRCQLGPGEH